MFQLTTALLCSRTIREADSNFISIIDVLEYLVIEAPEKDSILRLPLQCEVFTQWMREDIDKPCTGRIRFYLCDPTGFSKRNFEMEVDLSKKIFCRAILRIQGLEIRGPGKYEFKIEVQRNTDDWVLAGTVPFIVNYKLPK